MLLLLLLLTLTMHTWFNALPFVIGSGRVAVEEVITCITERFIVTRRTKQRHGATTQTAITRWRRALREKRYLVCLDSLLQTKPHLRNDEQNLNNQID